jgi:diguanylate cyclase (GGDEF)-like protein/PAS domain S-box-containing protein
VSELFSSPLVAGLLGLLVGLMLSVVAWRRSPGTGAGPLPAKPELMLESLGDAVIATDLQGRVIYVNPLAEQLTGVDRDLALGQPLETVFPARDIEQPARSIHPDVAYRFRELQQTPGHRIQIGESRAALRDARGRRIGWIHVLRDESEDFALRQALRESEARFQDFAETAADLYWEMDEELRFTRVSGKVRFLMGHDPEFVLGKTREELYAGQPVERTPEFEEHLRLIRERKPFSDFVASWRWDDGSIRYVNVSGKPLFDEEGRFIGYRGVSRDITEQKQAEERILHQALYDALTDLPNRGLAMDRLAQDIRQAARTGRQVAVLFLDLDDFKKINDSLGHDTGDRLLVEVAARLGGCLRGGDTVGRLGGDEFIVLLPQLKSPDEAGSVADKLLQSLSRPFHVMGRDLQISASIGIALCPEDGSDAAELLRKADAAMYQAKADGRNVFACFTEEMNRKVERRLAIEECMLGALERDEFRVLYQPKLALGSGELVGVEALLRWHNPGLGQISPA